MARFIISGINQIEDNTDVYLTEPVTTTQVKDYLQLAGTGYDTTLAIFITAARKQIETYCNVSLVAKSIRANIRNTTSDKPFPLPYPPIASVTQVIYKRCRSTILVEVYDTDWWFEDADADYKFIISDKSTQGSDQTMTIDYLTIPPNDMGIWKMAILAQVGYLYNNRDSENREGFAPATLAIINSMRNNYY